MRMVGWFLLPNLLDCFGCFLWTRFLGLCCFDVDIVGIFHQSWSSFGSLRRLWLFRDIAVSLGKPNKKNYYEMKLVRVFCHLLFYICGNFSQHCHTSVKGKNREKLHSYENLRDVKMVFLVIFLLKLIPF